MLQNYKYACVVKKNYKVANVILEFINYVTDFFNMLSSANLLGYTVIWSEVKKKRKI